MHMVARVVKNELRHRWREKGGRSKTPSSKLCHKVACNYLNLVFGNSEESKLYWQFEIKQELVLKFEGALSSRESAASYSLQTRPFLVELFKTIIDRMGIQLTPPAQEFSKHEQWYNPPNPLTERDLGKYKTKSPTLESYVSLVDILPITKTLNFIPYVEGIHLLKSSKKRDRNHYKWTLQSASAKFIGTVDI